MVSKNNMMLLENKQNRKNMRYGIRKFSSGTASVLLGFTVAGTVMMMANHEEASADTVGTQSNTNSLSSTTQNASVPIQSPKSQDVQNAVNNAVKQGVQVTQNNSQTIVAHNTAEVQKAQQQVSQANQQQADRINGVAQQQKQLNDQYAKAKADYDTSQSNTKDATTVNKQNSDKLQAAVQAAKAAGVQVTQNQTQTLTATNSTYNSVKQDVNNKYNQQVSSLKSITDAQKDLNNRYNSAKADAQNLNSDSNSTRNSLDSAIRNAKSANGVKLIDDGTRNVTVDVNNYNSKKAEIERDNRQQADSINSQVQQYKHKLDEYKNNLAKYEKEYNDYLASIQGKDSIDSKVIWQNLFLNFGNGAKLSVQWNAKPIEIHQNQTSGDDDYKQGFAKSLEYSAVFQGSHSGTVATATWLMPDGAYYKNLDGTKVRIAKVVGVLSNVVASGDNSNRVILGFFNNPIMHAFSAFANSVDETFYFYDDTGKLINFKDGTAWFGIASLNHFSSSMWDWYTQKEVTEKVKAISGAKIYTPKGDITLGDDGKTHEKQVPAQDLGNGFYGVNGTDYAGFAVAKISNGATFRWSKNGYNNAGDFHWDESKKIYLPSKAGYDGTEFTSAGNDTNNYYQWAMSTDLYGMAKTLIPPTPPTPPTVHYHHTNVALQH